MERFCHDVVEQDGRLDKNLFLLKRLESTY